ncbi:MAG: hypothetical protein AB7O99_09020 [Dongiaceae bacterium]
MANEFEISGHFYELSGLKCRRYLNIKRVGSNLSQPDIMVVMMNPGSSYPLDGIDNNNAPTEAHPDPTQDQIMAVMNNTGFNFARVLNLSDARQPSSNKFYEFLNSGSANSIPHSIFHQSRHDEFSALFRQGVPTIYGWGVNSNLEGLARKAIDRISEKNPIGIRKNGIEWAYYHPLPRIHAKQVEWVNTVSALLSNVPEPGSVLAL